MSSAFLLICLIVCFKQLIEAAMRQPLWLRIIHILLYVAFVALIHPYCLEISKLWVDSKLNTPHRLSDLSLIVMVDLLISVSAVLSLGGQCPTRASLKYDGVTTSFSKVWGRVAYMLPSPLFFAVIFYLRVQMLFVLPGVSFVGSSVFLALLIATLMLLAPRICRLLYLGSELSSLLGGVVLLITIVAGVFSSESRVYGNAGSEFLQQLMQVGILLLVITICAFVGYFYQRKCSNR